MDFDAKGASRKRFQDKQKLKHRHATPSARKYYAQQHQIDVAKNELERKEAEIKRLGDNTARYEHNDELDIGSAALDGDVLHDANEKLKDVLSRNLNSEPITSSGTRKLNRKEWQKMDLDTLKQAIEENGDDLNKNSSCTMHKNGLHHNDETKPDSSSMSKAKNAVNKSYVPKELEEEQKLLDELL